MANLVATDSHIITAKEMSVDYYNYSNHIFFEIPVTCKPHENDHITDIAVSNNGVNLAVITAISKQLIVYDLLETKIYKTFTLPRSASRLRFTVDNTQILVADKSGDILLFDIKTENPGVKLLGHLSLLLDVLQTNNQKFIISSDRDEKIKVSSYPNTYNIQTYCLGHKEFVNHIELLPHNDNYLTSSSGDGTVKIWNFIDGKLYHTIDTTDYVKDDQSKQNFVDMMDDSGIEVSALPIVHYTASCIDKCSSILAVTVLSCNNILIYSISNVDNTFTHELKYKLELDMSPSAIRLFKDTLFVYDDVNSCVKIYKLKVKNEIISVEQSGNVIMFENLLTISECKQNTHLEAIKVLYKRKFDNVQEYQERKKQRLEKTNVVL